MFFIQYFLRTCIRARAYILWYTIVRARAPDSSSFFLFYLYILFFIHIIRTHIIIIHVLYSYIIIFSSSSLYFPSLPPRVYSVHIQVRTARTHFILIIFFSSFVFYRYYIIRIRVHRIAHNIIINTLFCAVLVSAVPRPITAQSAYIPGIVLLYCATHR